MRRLASALLLTLVAASMFSAPLLADQFVKFNDNRNGLTLLEQDQEGMTVRMDLGELDFITVNTKEGSFTLPVAKGLTRSQNIGEPNLPTANSLVSIPFGCELEASVLDYRTVEVSLTDLGVTDPIMPTQPSLSKSDDPDAVPFEFDQQIYMESGYYTLPMATTRIVGTLRSERLGLVSVAPIEYNPTENKLIVYTEMTVRINYLNPDWNETQLMSESYYSPFFETVSGKTLNSEGFYRGGKEDLTSYPIKLVMIADRMFETQLQPLIEWKIKKGFIVVVGYTDVIGSTTASIKTFIQNEYTDPTPEDPAPSFVLLVGDIPQIPSWSGSAGSHVTDLRYVEFTGDDLPEIYHGRFSAQNTAELQPQIDKTLEYEQYLMPDPSYLSEVTLISGVDASHAPTWGNGQINYGTFYYFNLAHGIDPHVWLYPASGESGASAAIIQTVNEGVGFINYTAHCSPDGFGNPSFTVSDVNGLTNEHMYLLGVGNCCSSNEFDYSSPCFGEVWLRAPNKGGVGYLGGSNSTYWDEDYWWGVGNGPISANPTYEGTGLGTYDGAFHDHGEPVTEHYTTNYAMNVRGNLAVTEANSSRTQYYWEIYHLMGDPSVSNYMGVPSVNPVVHDGTILLTATSFVVQADPGSYVGLSKDGVLYGAGYIDASGVVNMSISPIGVPGPADLVVTAQNRQPYVTTVTVIAPDGPYVIFDSYTVDDATGNADGLVDGGEDIILGVQIKNVGPDDALDVNAILSTTDGDVTITDDSEYYGTVLGNDGTAYSADAFAFSVSPTCPDGHMVSFNLEVTGTARETWNSTITIPVHAPELSFVSVDVADNGNTNGVLDPGETALFTVTVSNAGSATASNTSGTLSSPDIYITVNDPDGSFGDISASGGEGDNSSNTFEVYADAGCDMGHEATFNVTLTTASGYTVDVNFMLIVGDRVEFFVENFTFPHDWTGLGGSAEWEIGTPSGGSSGSSSDPTEDHTQDGANQVMGNDLGASGNYNNNISPTQWITSPVIDCSGYTGVLFSLWHWNGFERDSWDHAYLQVYDGVEWVTLWENGGSSFGETSWNFDEYDVSPYADNNSNFQIRFGLGLTDGSITYAGWNIDDIVLKGYGDGGGGDAQLVLTPDSIVDSLAAGDPSVHTFKIKNIGTTVLWVRFTTTDSWIQFDGEQQAIAPDDSLDFEVTVVTDDLLLGDNIGSIHYLSNDQSNATGDIPCTIHIYAPVMVCNTSEITETVEQGKVDTVSVLIENTGPGKLDYSILCEVFDSPPVATKVVGSIPTVAEGIEPLGYRPADPEKGFDKEPYFAPVEKGSGGPDNFGYSWIDSDEAGGPQFDWVDIQSQGTEITGLSDDSFVGPFPIGFTFSYYDTDYTEFYVSSNGFIGFGPTDSYNSTSNNSLPTSGTPNNILAWCWDDLNPLDSDNPGAKVLYHSSGDSLVIQFVDYPEFNAAAGDVINAEVILQGDGTIKYQYLTIAASFDILGATVGIENETGTDGLTVVHNASYLHDNLAVEIVSIIHWLSAEPLSGSIAPFSSENIDVVLDATELEVGDYFGQITITGNDPLNGSQAIPVNLTVGQAFTPGDADGDGICDVADAVFIISYVFIPGSPAPDPYEAGDVTCDDIVDVSDAVFILNFVFIPGSPVPAPCE